jgi:hypothetical protein
LRGAQARLALVAIAAALAAGPASGQVQRVEAVGSVPLAAGAAGGGTARQAALEAAVRDAVQRAAVDLASQAGSAAPAEAIAGALGRDPLVYAAGYRIVEDHGERAPLLETSPAAEREYVVSAQVEVDVAKVRARLREAGLLGAPAGAARHGLRLAIEGIDSYPLWERIQRGLAARGGAVRPLEFRRGRIVAEVQTDESPGALVERLGTLLDEGLTVHSVGFDEGEIRVAIRRNEVATPASPEGVEPLAPPGADEAASDPAPR